MYDNVTPNKVAVIFELQLLFFQTSMRMKYSVNGLLFITIVHYHERVVSVIY